MTPVRPVPKFLWPLPTPVGSAGKGTLTGAQRRSGSAGRGTRTGARRCTSWPLLGCLDRLVEVPLIQRPELLSAQVAQRILGVVDLVLECQVVLALELDAVPHRFCGISVFELPDECVAHICALLTLPPINDLVRAAVLRVAGFAPMRSKKGAKGRLLLLVRRIPIDAPMRRVPGVMGLGQQVDKTTVAVRNCEVQGRFPLVGRQVDDALRDRDLQHLEQDR